MRTTKLIIPAIIFAFTCLQSCVSKKDFDHCDGTLTAKVIADSMVIAGHEINLSVEGIDHVINYTWRGPNKFFSKTSESVIYNATAVNAGKYTVDMITTEGCSYTATTDSIIIKTIEAPCTPTNNWAAFSNTFSILFSTPRAYVEGDSYFVTAKGSGGDLTIEFPGVDRPLNNIYEIQPVGGNWAKGNIRVKINNSGVLYTTGSGNVYVTASNSKSLILTFCDVPFTGSNGFKTVVSCKLTIPLG